MRRAQTEHSYDDLASAFADQRPQLRGIAYRMLGSYWDAEDAVQETWLRLQRSDTAAIDNLAAWLTTVVSRVSIDHLRSRQARPEDSDSELPENDPTDESWGPESTALRADEVGAAMMVVLDTLGPLERLAFVLHDIFGLAFDDIAPIVDRTTGATRQLASRARRRIRAVDARAERSRHKEAVGAFLKAAREGDFGTLLQLLDPEVELRADTQIVDSVAAFAEQGAPLLQPRVQGADAVARAFAGRAEQAQLALIDGVHGAVYAPGGVVKAAYAVHLRDGRISCIEVIGDPARVAELAVANRP